VGNVSVWVRACGHLYLSNTDEHTNHEKQRISEEEATALILAGAVRIVSKIDCWKCYMKNEYPTLKRKHRRAQDKTRK